MRCRSCSEPAGFWRRWCADCRNLLATWQTHRFDGMRGLLEALRGTGAAHEKIERFLESEPEAGRGKVRDQIAADMANQLLDALGQRSEQTGAGVQRLRERGAWRVLDRRPES
jgi:hypothetical protein